MTWTVLMTDRLHERAEIEEAILGERFRVRLGGARHEREIPVDAWAEADAVLAWHDVRLTPEIIAQLNRCRLIVRIGVGYDNVAIQAAGERGIPVCNIPDYGTNEVADHALGMLLSLARGFDSFGESARAGLWDWDFNRPIHRLTGSTLGIVGLGRIGMAMARRGQALGMSVAFYDPYLADGVDKALGLTRYDRLHDLLARSQAVSLHVPLTAETRGLGDAAFFAALPPGAILVNTARGPVLELAALEAALRSGHLYAAGLDVIPQEPPDWSHPLLSDWRARAPWLTGRLLLTPHIAFYSHEGFIEMREKAAREVLRVFNGEAPRNCVNRQWLKA